MIEFFNIGRLLTLEGVQKKDGRKIEPKDLSEYHGASLVITSGKSRNKVLWVGRGDDLPTKFKKAKRVNCHGALVMPGLVDSHTHLVFGGDRSQEFEMRLQGKSYSEIAASGGGILRTVQATRSQTLAELTKSSLLKLKSLRNQGVSTVEIKTGYALDFENERKCLKVIGDLKKKTSQTLCSTFLGAHAIPPEFKGRKSEYVDEVCNWLPKIKADFVDMFVDEGYFDFDDGLKFFETAKKLGFNIKVHADELALSGGSRLAVEMKALSADHLLKVGDSEINLLAQSQTTATLLPTTAMFLKTDFAPARKLLAAGARVALASDYNPGTSPTLDLSLVALLATLGMDMRVDEVVAALTYNGACALDLQKHKGCLLPNYDADFLIAEADSPGFLAYHFGKPGLPVQLYCNGTKS